MKQVIYVDVLVAVNLFVNYFLLLGTARFFSMSVKRSRLILAASLGAVYSLYMLLPELHFLFNIIIKLLMSFTIILAAFGFRSPRVFLKTSACFYAMNFAFAGIMAALWYFAAPKGLALNNGIVYFNVSPLLLVMATLICYFIVRIIHRLTGQGASKDLLYQVVVHLGERAVSFQAKVDTGNTLVEPFSHVPALVAEYQAVQEALPDEAKLLFTPNLVAAGGMISTPNPWQAKCRMVPFQAVSGEGVLPAFRPDYIEIISGKIRQKKDAYVAVCESGMFHGEYAALLNPQLIP